MIFDRKKSIWVFCLLIFAGFYGMNWYLCGFIGAVWSLLLLLTHMGKDIPVLEMPMLLGGVQWVAVPYMIYHLPDVSSYPMLLRPEYYAEVAVPAYLLFCLGIELFNQKISLRESGGSNHSESSTDRESCTAETDTVSGRFILILLIAGTMGFFMQYTFLSVGSFASMLESLWGIAAISALFLPSKPIRFCILIPFGIYLLWRSLSWGGFHELLIWGFWFFAYIAYKKKAGLKKIIPAFCAAMLFVGICQGVKWKYRHALFDEGKGVSLSMFTDMAADWTKTRASSILDDEDFLIRFNQGWHISLVILHMDATGRYLDGASIWDSVVSILLPRYLAPNKRSAGGRENFATMTSHHLVGGTSMNVSYIGEGYGNWGKCGAWFFTFATGMLLGLSVRFTKFIMRFRKEIFYFIPVIFFFAVKVEADFFMTFNQYVKVTLISLVIVCIYRFLSAPPSTVGEVSITTGEGSLQAPQKECKNDSENGRMKEVSSSK